MTSMPETVGHPPTVAGDPLLLIGDTDLSDAVADHLNQWDVPVSRLDAPDDDVLLKTLREGADAVAVVCRDDIHALRYALLAEHILPGVPLLVTLFDKTVAEEVVRSVPNCTVISMTDALVPAILGPCVGAEFLSLFRADGGYVSVRRSGSDAVVEPLPETPRRVPDRFLLQKLSLPKARALAAVSSQPLENIAVAVAARSLAPDQRIVLRSGGDEDVTAESRSLFRIATVCDLNTIAGSFIAATAAGLSPRTTFTIGDRVHAVLGDDLVAL